MFAQFHRLLTKIAEENRKVFHGTVPSVYTLNRPQGIQAAKLGSEKQEVKRRSSDRCCGSYAVRRTLVSQ